MNKRPRPGAVVLKSIEKARQGLERAGANGEIVVGDNGSTDGSAAAAQKAGARVVRAAVKGYGSALRGGIGAARGRWIIMGDTDGSHDFSHVERFVQKLDEGYDLVIWVPLSSRRRDHRSGCHVLQEPLDWQSEPAFHRKAILPLPSPGFSFRAARVYERGVRAAAIKNRRHGVRFRNGHQSYFEIAAVRGSADHNVSGRALPTAPPAPSITRSRQPGVNNSLRGLRRRASRKRHEPRSALNVHYPEEAHFSR